ncbi:uncharacterized protein LOC110917784 isoform X2 [Helianthus annuus]|uniref:uncharacterized protein LOC110917784 isoform X2 n=1 Tax=Helianthus annuus TaxID=4232 RepID=UPI000B900228|nr:uncharacterized protein LOC110917784 isoform X2 [Helianthus annuus]XP_035841689.1 uncharacterized protein LOC110917784 isoform X2 [Helianthus annuus]
MDYDDDEFQGQNRQLAGEGSSKVSPVLHPYALPKFDFDDTLHEHLSFNEVFLGQEDNQWIEEFKSSGVESRRNNVWSEATSSESVEMLLKSVGQEEKVVGKVVIEQLDSNICDETVSLTEAMDPNLNQESQLSGGELDSVSINEKQNLFVLKEKVDNTFDDVVPTDHPGSSENVGLSVQIKENSTEVPADGDTMIAEYVDNPSSENLPAETSIPSNENLSDEISDPFSKNSSAETSNTISENPTAENSIPFSENLPTENSAPFRESRSAENSTPIRENPPAETSISFIENQSAKTSITLSENPPTGTRIPFNDNPPAETSILIPSTETSIPFSEKPPAESNIPFSESTSQLLKLKDPDSPKSNAGSLSKMSPITVSSVEENETIIEKDAQQIHSDTSMLSAGNLPETVCESSGLMQVDCKATSCEPGVIHLGQDDSFNEKEDASLPPESKDMDAEAVQAHATAENEEQPKSPIFGVSLVHQGSKENIQVGGPSEGNSQNEISQVECVVASDSKNPSALVEKEASPDLAEKAIHEIDAHCVTPVESCNASQVEREPGTKNDSQDCSEKLETNPSDLLEKTVNNSQTGCLQDPKETVIEVNKSNEHQTFVDGSRPSDDVADGSSLSCKTADDVQNKALSVSVDNATPEEKDLTFEVNKRSDLGQDGKGSLSYPAFQVSNLPKITEGPSKDSSSNQRDPKKFHEVSVSPQNPSGLTSQIGIKGKSERKPRRKSVGKENARKGTVPARGEVSPVLLTSPATSQVTRFEGVKSRENATKPGVLPSPKIPDLNNSTSILQQPFTDNQQVQLRAQILVYGSLISGSPPEETYMIAAFGQPDGGRTWEGVWRACVERLHIQKSQPKSSTPIQSRLEMRDAGSRSDQVIKQASVQNKIPSSPIGGPNSKGTPPIVSPMIPFSSPLWNTTTPSDNLQSTGMPKAARFDYHQTLSPLRPPTYQTPPVQNYNSSWLSQGPFSGQWLAASPIPSFNPAPRFPSLPTTESLKLTPVKESGGSVVQHTSNPPILNSAPIIFPDMKRSTVSSDQPCDSKSRKRKKGIPVVSNPCSTSVAVSIPTFVTSKSSPATILSPTHHTDQNAEKVEESKLQAKEATEHADKAMLHCNGVWSQMEGRYNHNLNSNDEAKLVSAAVSVAAAASVAKVAAAAAKIASEQARSMANSLNKNQNLVQSKASSKHAENLDAIVKAAELAAEAVSQAGKIVAMSEPFTLRDLVEAGPEGYWKTPRLASKQQQALIAQNLNVSEKRNAEKGTGGNLTENQTMEVDGTSVPFTSHGKDKRKPPSPGVFKTIGAVPESEIKSMVGQSEPKISSANLIECDIKEGCLVEVYKDDDKLNCGWFGANVLSLKDGKALVSYTEIQSDEGSGKLKEWLALEVEGSEVPKIRLAHPVTSMQGTRKRRRTAATDFMWSSGDRVDVWIQNHWREGVVMETNTIDVTSLTVQFPAQGETSVVRSWFVRPPLIWKDGKWIMSHTSEKRVSSPGNMPQEKRLKLASPAVEDKRKAGSSEPRKQEESLSLSTHEKVFNVGSTRENKKINTSRTMTRGLQKEGPGVTFGVPKPGKNQKFMDVSKHYVADGSNVTHDSIKFTKYLIPHPPGSRGWKNSSRSDPKEKQVAEAKPQMLKSRKPPIPSFRTLSTKSTANNSSLDSVSDSENQLEHGSSSSIEDKSERLNKRKFAPTKAAKVEKSHPEVAEPRRSNRKIQPTSRLLEGLQSSMSISKIPAVSHSTQRKVTPIQKETGTLAKRKENS